VVWSERNGASRWGCWDFVRVAALFVCLSGWLSVARDGTLALMYEFVGGRLGRFCGVAAHDGEIGEICAPAWEGRDRSLVVAPFVCTIDDRGIAALWLACL